MITVEPAGTYRVFFPDVAWEFRGDIGAPLTSVVQSGGADAAGPWQQVSFDFVTDAVRHASIRSYPQRSAVVFSVFATTATANSFAFPSWTDYPHLVNHLSYSGIFAPPSFYALAPESPWVFFDPAYRTFIQSPAANFMTGATDWGSRGELATGIARQIPTLPAGFEQKSILVAATGINRTFDLWGQTLTDLQGKHRPANDADVSLNRLGYWTDNGASYYYQMAPGMNYEQTLMAVRGEFDRIGITPGYLQLDSWFYPKGPGALWSNNGQGIYEYVAASPPFSAGLARFQQRAGVPLITHARWIDLSSPYRRSYRMSGNVVLDRAYWDTVAAYLANSGVATYEQDWLADKAQTDFNLNDGAEFLDNMAAAMLARNLTMQYCMASPRHFLQGAKYSHLTTIRTSGDRLERDRWTDFLYTSRLASALGMWPFTDNFNSSETTHLLIATLSAGPVGVGDPVGAFQPANLLRAARRDGVIVKPDAPLAPVDSSYLAMANHVDMPQLNATYSDHGGRRTSYLFAYSQGANTTARFTTADLGATAQVYLYDYFAGQGQVVSPDDPVEYQVPYDGLYLIAAPVGPSGIALLGDTGQFVSMGNKRVVDYTDDGRVRVAVTFAPGETSRVLQGYAPAQPVALATQGNIGDIAWDAAAHRFSIRVTPGANGQAAIELHRPRPRAR